MSSAQSLLFSKLNKPSSLNFMAEMLQPSDHLSGPPLDSFQVLSIFLVLGAPGLDAVLQMGPH